MRHYFAAAVNCVRTCNFQATHRIMTLQSAMTTNGATDRRQCVSSRPLARVVEFIHHDSSQQRPPEAQWQRWQADNTGIGIKLTAGSAARGSNNSGLSR